MLQNKHGISPSLYQDKLDFSKSDTVPGESKNLKLVEILGIDLKTDFKGAYFHQKESRVGLRHIHRYGDENETPKGVMKNFIILLDVWLVALLCSRLVFCSAPLQSSYCGCIV